MISLYGEEIYWLITNDKEQAARSLADRHYSRKTPGSPKGFMGPGEHLILISPDGKALFGWLRARPDMRRDHIDGIYCAIFRNESSILSSTLILEAEKFAQRKWPGLMMFTYVDQGKVKSKKPGWSFIKAGWVEAGHSKKGLILLKKEVIK